MRFKPLIPENTIDNPKEDFERGQKLSRYVMGEKALYIPHGFSWEYIPYAAVTKAQVRTQNYAAKGCCGSGVKKLPVLVIEYDFRKQIRQCDSMEDVERVEQIIGLAYQLTE